MDGSPRWRLCAQDLWKIGKGALIAAVGAGLAYATAHVGEFSNTDMARTYPVLIPIYSIMINTLWKWWQDHCAPPPPPRA